MSRKISMKQAINEALDLEMRRDPTVIVMGEDIVGGTGAHGEEDAWGGVLGVTKGLYAKHGDRLMDTPLSESAYIGAAIGAFIFGMTNQGIVYAGWDPDWFKFFLGAMLLFAVIANNAFRNYAAKK